ncbi:MAG: DUF928 domain-containing protein [Okeania sp. SIO2C2]|uniref:DUF928 domain-containing protein n=1 Tax=Okeania sp. SIO2C2 TaxID=2607787 RepID=UPI0013B8F3EE|nr:DUF928 domain-containing protein [Okeania sp. SIO2C2]NEP87942.1 DUF928 domain-containing protein [Okeania sp. SIO2C2]
MRYLLLITTLSVVLMMKLLNIAGVVQRPAFAIPSFGNISNDWRISQTYIPPDRGAPPTTTSSGTRGGEQCLLSEKKIVPLLIPGNNIGVTLSKHPTFFIYIPPYQKAQKARFFLTEWISQEEIYEEDFQLPKKSGIIKIKIPAEKSAPLEIGKTYIWGVQIWCEYDPLGESADYFSQGFIERIQADRYLLEKLKTARPLTLSTVYASQGIWYDALESIVELRSLNIENPQLIDDWKKLFESANSQGKEEFIQAPVLDCCQRED